MQGSQSHSEDVDRQSEFVKLPHIVIGITSAQTCLVLKGRLRALRESGFRVTLISSPGELLDEVGFTEGIATVALSMEREIAVFRDLVSLLRMWQLLRRLKPDVVEFSTPKAGLLGMLASRLTGVPRRVYFVRGLKLETATGIKRRILHAAERLSAACSHRVMCNSESLRYRVGELGVAPEGKLKLLGAGSSVGVDLSHFCPRGVNVRDRMNIPKKAAVLGFVGRLTRDKGIPELLEAFEDIQRFKQDCYLLLVGWFDSSEDAVNEDLRRKIVSHPRVICTGFVEDVAPCYRAMDVLILPSMREGFPNVVLEASACGIPVITTLSTGAKDAVVPEVTGLLIPSGRPEAIVEASLRLLGDVELRRRMGSCGREWVMAQFSRKKVLDRNVRFYKELLADPTVQN